MLASSWVKKLFQYLLPSNSSRQSGFSFCVSLEVPSYAKFVVKSWMNSSFFFENQKWLRLASWISSNLVFGIAIAFQWVIPISCDLYHPPPLCGLFSRQMVTVTIIIILHISDVTVWRRAYTHNFVKTGHFASVSGRHFESCVSCCLASMSYKIAVLSFQCVTKVYYFCKLRCDHLNFADETDMFEFQKPLF